jgi:hypothetical protein
MRAFLGLLTALLLVGVLVGTGSAIYNQGVAAGINAADSEASDGGIRADDGPYIGDPVAFGIEQLVGLLFSVLLVVIIVGLARAAFGIGRHGPPGGGWGHGDRRGRIEEWHRELHRREQGGGEQTPAGV